MKGDEGLPGAAEIKGNKGEVGEIYEGEAALVGFDSRVKRTQGRGGISRRNVAGRRWIRGRKG